MCFLRFLSYLRPCFLVAQLVKNLPAIRDTWDWAWVGKIPWRREWLPTLVFWPGELHGLYSPWGHIELDTTEWLHHFTDTVEVKWFLGAYWKYCPCWLRGEKTWIRTGSTDGQVILKKKKKALQDGRLNSRFSLEAVFITVSQTSSPPEKTNSLTSLRTLSWDQEVRETALQIAVKFYS